MTLETRQFWVGMCYSDKWDERANILAGNMFQPSRFRDKLVQYAIVVWDREFGGRGRRGT
jgi:hypothetical protein